ncbi:MAG: NAD-dependent DNA ligase LigA [Chitinophagaceae bacterium]
MYSKEKEISLHQQCRRLLGQSPPIFASDPAQYLPELREVINYLDWRYYVQSDPVMSDYEYDQLFSLLKNLEQKNPDLQSADSPTHRVARGITKEFFTVPHLVPMLSLENSYDAQDLIDWDRKAKELTGLSELEYCIEPKYDGAGISLIYENDLLTRGTTRGDGVEGEEITQNIKQIRSIPLSAPFSRYGIHQVEIRGEVLITKETFKKFNAGRIRENLPPLANPRNAASGSLRMVDPREVGKRGLSAVFYHLSFHHMQDQQAEPPQMQTHFNTLQLFSKLCLPNPSKDMKLVRGIEAVIQYCQDFESGREALPFEIDGMVIKVNSYALQEKMGMTTHHPRWAIAFKFKSQQATSKLRRVEFQVGRTGSITPVAKIDPVPLGGVTVSSVSLFNEEVVREKDFRIGDTVLVERAGDVIPYLVKSMADLRDGTEEYIRFPTHCPVCGDALLKPAGESVWRCNNINCEAQVIERLIHFVSKDAMDIGNLGESNIRKFFTLGLLKDIPGLYQLDFDQVKKLEGFGEKSVEHLRVSLENSKHQDLHRLIFGLGIRYVGETTAKTLSHAVEQLPDLRDWEETQLLSLPDIGPKVAGSVYQFFHHPDNIRMILKLSELGVNLKNIRNQLPETGGLGGQTFLFTGTLSKLKRSEAEKMVEEKGGIVLGTVSSKLQYLVAGEEAGSKLEKAKKIPSIRILHEEEFIQMLNQQKN